MLSQIFDGATADGDSLVVDHGGGEVEIIVAGGLGGGTVTAKARYVGTDTWVPLDGGTWTTEMIKILKTVRPCEIRLTLSSATSATLDAWI